MKHLLKVAEKIAVRRADRTRLGIAVVILALAFASFSLAAAQSTPSPATGGGTTLRGTINDQTKTVNYSYSATAGDILSAHVIGLTEGMIPTLKLLSPTQESLADSTNDVFSASDDPDTRLSYVLIKAGTYTLQVGGTNGDFVLHFSVRQANPKGALVVGAATTVDTSPGVVQVYTFAPDPNNDLTLSITSTTSDFAFAAQVYAPTGGLVASLGGPQFPSAQLVFGPVAANGSSGVYEVSVAALSADKQGSVTLLLSPGGTAASATPGVGPTSTPAGSGTPQATPAATSAGTSSAPTDVCTASPNSKASVNERSGPGPFYPIIRSLLPGSFLIINGRNANGTWYVSILGNKQAWVFGGVVTLSGPCNALRVIQAPLVPTPAVTAHH